MVAEILAGIALIKASVSAVRSVVETCQDVGEVSGQISSALQGQRDCQKARSKDKGMSIAQQFGSDSPTQKVIDAKLADELVSELQFMVIQRWDKKTWDMIVEAEKEKVQQDKLAAIAERSAKAEAKQQTEEIVVLLSSIGIGLLIVVGVALVFWARKGQ